MASPPSAATPSGKKQSLLTKSGIQPQDVVDPRTDLSPELSGVAVAKNDFGFDSPMEDGELLPDEVLAELDEINGTVLLSHDEFPAHILLIQLYNCLYVSRYILDKNHHLHPHPRTSPTFQEYGRFRSANLQVAKLTSPLGWIKTLQGVSVVGPLADKVSSM